MLIIRRAVGEMQCAMQYDPPSGAAWGAPIQERGRMQLPATGAAMH